MKVCDLTNVLGRAKRLRARIENKCGEEARWSCKCVDGQTHEYVISGVKSVEEIKDDIESTYVWLWSLKDYLKKYMKSKGEVESSIEEMVNLDRSMCIIADVANGLKHGGLDRKTRSGQAVKLGPVNYRFSLDALDSMAISDFGVKINIFDTNKVELKMYLLDKDGNEIGDALALLDYGINTWERIVGQSM